MFHSLITMVLLVVLCKTAEEKIPCVKGLGIIILLSSGDIFCGLGSRIEDLVSFHTLFINDPPCYVTSEIYH